MKKRFLGSTALLALALATVALPARAQNAKPMEEKQMKPAAGARADIVKSIDDAQKKLVALAEAMPADKYGWRPGEGVRSVGEVFAHVSGTNYFLPALWGGKVPDGVDPRGFEKEAGDKAKTIGNLKKSFESVRQVIDAVPDSDLDRVIPIFDHQGAVREAMLAVATHAHEHLGQSIAYARMNGVTPPWSAQAP